MPRKKSSRKKRSKCNSRKKSTTCPKKSCSWVRGRKTSTGRRIKPHCKDNPKKGSKHISPCRKKKMSPCKTAKACNWVKRHSGRNGVKISGFCKSNPKKGIHRRRPFTSSELQQMTGFVQNRGAYEEDSSSDDSSDDEEIKVNPVDRMSVALQPASVYNSGSEGYKSRGQNMSNVSMPSSANAMQQLMAQPYGLNASNNKVLSPLAQYSLLQSLSNNSLH